MNSWDPIVVFIITEKLGPQARARWNDQLGATRESLSYKELDAFLDDRIHSLSDIPGEVKTAIENPRSKGRSFVHTISVQSCVHCVGSHSEV
jgi:hypothetical protein